MRLVNPPRSVPIPEPDPALELPEPSIIARSQHTISRANIDPEALKVLYRLHRHGFVAYLVGGSVRDLLLGRRPKDFDISTDAHPSQVQKLFRNSRVIGRRFRLVQVFFQRGKVVEVSTFRRLADPDDDAVLQANNTFGTPAEDALRRDLTINALFYNIADYTVVDYVGGLADLRAGLIRSVGDPEIRFRRDPVRVLRAVRHAARTGFILTPDTLTAVQNHSSELAVCPSSRVRDELMRDLTGGAIAPWLELAHASGLLYSLLPTLEPYYREENSEARAKAVELLKRVDQAVAVGDSPDESVILAALLWPALEEAAKGEELPPGRLGRARWSVLVRRLLPQMAQPVAFARRVVDRACQAAGLLAILIQPQAERRLPRKLTDKGYFADACRLAELLGYDLHELTGMGRPDPAGHARPRRRRRRRKPPAQA